MTTMQQATARLTEGEAFYERNSAFNKAPVWERLHRSVAARPATRHWNFQRYLKTVGLVTMVGVSVSLAMPTGKAQAAGNFSLSCNNMDVNSADFSNTASLTANCLDGHGHSVGANINLNDLIGDDLDGHLQWATHGHFQQSCRRTFIENPYDEPKPHKILTYCRRADGSEVGTDIDLNDHIANILGSLKFVR